MSERSGVNPASAAFELCDFRQVPKACNGAWNEGGKNEQEELPEAGITGWYRGDHKAPASHLPHTACWRVISSPNCARDYHTSQLGHVINAYKSFLGLHFQIGNSSQFVCPFSRKGVRCNLASCNLKCK